ncbi:hypothetical protein P3T37_004964 [Kitasatospora sp. MAA4]|nr:hypothetical protein [Kitasatospora sp. MAA4]
MVVQAPHPLRFLTLPVAAGVAASRAEHVASYPADWR